MKLQQCKVRVMKTTHYVTDEANICLKDLALHITSKICHAHYEEQDLERSFFMVEVIR